MRVPFFFFWIGSIVQTREKKKRWGLTLNTVTKNDNNKQMHRNVKQRSCSVEGNQELI